MEQLRTIRTFSWCIAILIGLTSWYGLFSPDAYTNNTDDWATQAMGQDLINILILPFYLYSVLFINRKRNSFPLVWVGITCYFIYTFLIYSFDIDFNRMFLLYTSILGLTVYSLLFLFYSNKNKFHILPSSPFSEQLTGGYFIFTALLFCGLWLSEILPANVLNTTPDSLENLPTNPVQVLDLSIVLPGFFTAGMLIIRKKRLGYILAPVGLTFSFLMHTTIGILMLFPHQSVKHIPETAWLMFMLATFSLVLLLLQLKKNHVPL